MSEKKVFFGRLSSFAGESDLTRKAQQSVEHLEIGKVVIKGGKVTRDENGNLSFSGILGDIQNGRHVGGRRRK